MIASPPHPPLGNLDLRANTSMLYGSRVAMMASMLGTDHRTVRTTIAVCLRVHPTPSLPPCTIESGCRTYLRGAATAIPFSTRIAESQDNRERWRERDRTFRERNGSRTQAVPRSIAHIAYLGRMALWPGWLEAKHLRTSTRASQ